MKIKKGILLIATLCSLAIAIAQTNPGETIDDLMDGQTQVMGGVIGDSLVGIPPIGYLHFLKKSTLPASEKQKLEEYYLMYTKTLDEKGKDSLNTAMLKDLMQLSKKDTLN